MGKTETPNRRGSWKKTEEATPCRVDTTSTGNAAGACPAHQLHELRAALSQCFLFVPAGCPLQDSVCLWRLQQVFSWSGPFVAVLWGHTRPFALLDCPACSALRLQTLKLSLWPESLWPRSVCLCLGGLSFWYRLGTGSEKARFKMRCSAQLSLIPCLPFPQPLCIVVPMALILCTGSLEVVEVRGQRTIKKHSV